MRQWDLGKLVNTSLNVEFKNVVIHKIEDLGQLFDNIWWRDARTRSNNTINLSYIYLLTSIIFGGERLDWSK